MPRKISKPSRYEAGSSRQVFWAIAIFAGILLLIAAMLIARRWVPGFFGEYLAGIAGVVTTPFLLEATFIILGLVIVVALNHWRQKRDGDEFVYLDELPASSTEPPNLEQRLSEARSTGDHEKIARLEVQIRERNHR